MVGKAGELRLERQVWFTVWFELRLERQVWFIVWFELWLERRVWFIVWFEFRSYLWFWSGEKVLLKFELS